MRRLYYSAMSGAVAGPRFDAVIAGNNSDVPMYDPVVPATTIDRLFETSAITTPRGVVDVSHHGYSSASGAGSTGDADVASYRPMIDEIARRFTNFLTTGLASGDAPWP
jgi:hypothetical protein